MIIAIDGPSGVGKGTLAKHLAKKYNLALLDTGLLYRAVGLLCLENNLDPDNPDQAFEAAQKDLTEIMGDPRLRTEEVGQAASKASVHSKVRDQLLDFQRNFAKNPPKGYDGVILDGRDIGTNILPNADVKFYLVATPDVRALRRFKELEEKGVETTYLKVLEDIKERDHRDRTRDLNPLRPAKDAIILDTSEYSIEEVVEKSILAIENRR
jgi:cytidylate kinase